MKLIPALLTTLVAWTCVSAFAQWQWIDKDGHKVFSDRAPPIDVMDKNILQRPSNRVAAPAPTVSEPAADSGASAAAAANPPAGPKATGVDKELEAKKKATADAEAAKKKADEERVTKARIENCARAKQAKVSYESGVRISRTNAAGEREVLDDAARAAEIKRIQAMMDADCR